MRKIKVAQIGMSDMGHGVQVWNTMVKLSDYFEVVGYAFPENERERYRKYEGIFAPFEPFREMTVDEILEDSEIEAVVIETQEVSLTKYAMMAAKAGKHIHMEKPGGTDLQEFEELIELVRSKGLTFTIGYMYRFNPKVLEALEKVKNGVIGDVYSVEAYMDCRHHPVTRQQLEHYPGGMLFWLGCHLIDLIYQIQGEPEDVVPLSCSTGPDVVDAKDFGMVALKYKYGVSFAKCSANEVCGFTRRQLVVCGTKGTIEIRPLEVLVPEVQDGVYTVMHEMHEDGGNTWNGPGVVTESEIFPRYDAMMVHFAEVLRGEKENPYTYDYELCMHRLLQRCCEE